MELLLDRVGRIYSWNWAVQDVSTQIIPGSIVCILGANGSGKSTLLKLISGSMRPTSGSVQIDGRPIRMGAIGLRKRMMLIQPDQIRIGTSISAHLGTVMSLYGKDEPGIEDVAAKWIDEFGLTSKVLDTQSRLSRGQKCKLWLASLFTVRPELWLFDEPHQCGLDARGVEILEEQIREHCRTGGTVIFTSQWPPHARRLAQQVILLDEGRLAYAGNTETLAQSFGSHDPQVAAIVRLLESDTVGTV